MSEDTSYMKLLSGASSKDGCKAADIYPFGISPLDIILGGGLYAGKIYEIYGRPSHGKSTIALEASKAFTRYCEDPKHGIDKYAVLWIETESAFDKVRATYMGCKMSRFITFEALTIEAGFNMIIETLSKCEKNGIRLFIVWDTIAAVQTEANLKSQGQWSGGMAEIPRLLAHYMKTMTQSFGNTNSTMIFVNQISEVFGGNGGVESKGGYAIKFHASLRLEVKKVSQIMGCTPVGTLVERGIITRVHTKKSKLSNPRQYLDLAIDNENGLQGTVTIFNFLKGIKKIPVGGGGWATIEYTGKSGAKQVKFQSPEKLIEAISFDPEIGEFLDYQIYDYFKDTSPLTKVRIINELWAYEEQFCGGRQTILDPREIEAAEILYGELQKEEKE